MIDKKAFDDASACLQKASRIIVVSHYHPDADAYGSSGGLTLALRSLGKEVFLVNETPLSESYKIIPGALSTLNAFPTGNFDVVVACDCGSISRVGDSLLPQVKNALLLINIDHHVSNDMFGAINVVDHLASSSAEIVFQLLKHMNVKITADIASALFCGIAGDTGSFRYASASENAFALTAELVRAGARPDVLSGELFGNSPLCAVQLQSEALRNVTMHFDNKVAEVVVTNDMYQKFKAGTEDTEALVERARDIRGVMISFLIKQDGDIWRVSLRSKSPQYNLSELAGGFGGGGHVVAAAFRWRHDLEELRKVLLEKIGKMLERK